MKTNHTKEKAWHEAKKKYRLPQEVIQMAKQLGLNSKKFGSLATISKKLGRSPCRILLGGSMRNVLVSASLK